MKILINNAGIQTAALECTEGEKDINTNLLGTMNVTAKYAFQPKINPYFLTLLFLPSTAMNSPFMLLQKQEL